MIKSTHELRPVVVDQLLHMRISELFARDILGIPGVRAALIAHWEEFMVEEYNEDPDLIELLADDEV